MRARSVEDCTERTEGLKKKTEEAARWDPGGEASRRPRASLLIYQLGRQRQKKGPCKRESDKRGPKKMKKVPKREKSLKQPGGKNHPFFFVP